MIENLFKPGKITVIADAFWGSGGKGSNTVFVAKGESLLKCVATPNQPSAGHTSVLSPSEYTGRVVNGNPAFTVLEDGDYKIVLKCLPSSAFATKEIPICLTCDAGFKIDRLMQEVALVDDPSRIKIHPNAVVVTDEHKKGAEETGRHLSGTMQGGGHASAEKMLRKPGVRLAKDYDELRPFICNTSEVIHDVLEDGGAVLLELPQGYGLSLNHGYVYPYLTSRDITPAFAMNTCNASPKRMGAFMGIVRPFPIRVGSIENSTSGGCFDDQFEITWDDVTRFSGAGKEGVKIIEMTTVTGRVRRVFTFSKKQLRDFVRHCEPDFLSLTFTSQIDYRSYGKSSLGEIPSDALDKIARFVAMIEKVAGGVKVAILGTGPKNRHQIEVLHDDAFQAMVASHAADCDAVADEIASEIGSYKFECEDCHF